MKILRTYPNGHTIGYTVLSVDLDVENKAALVETVEKGSVVFTKLDTPDVFEQILSNLP